jgi:hypothetical protein
VNLLGRLAATNREGDRLADAPTIELLEGIGLDSGNTEQVLVGTDVAVVGHAHIMYPS